MTKPYNRTIPGRSVWNAVDVDYYGNAYPSSRVYPGTAAISSLSWSSKDGNRHTPNPHSWGYTKRGYLNGSISGTTSPTKPYQESSYTGVLFGDNDGLSLPPLTPGRLSYNQALSRLNNRVRGSLNLAVDVAEYKSTARMFNLLDTAEDAAKSLVRFKKRLVSINGVKRYGFSHDRSGQIQREFYLNYRKFGESLNGAYLSSTFGWGPLLSTLYGAADELIRPPPMSNVVRLNGAFRASESFAFQTTRAHPISAKAPPVQLLVEGKVDDFTRICVLLSNNQSSIDTRRWVSYAPFSTAYELIPYSFVLDYFWNLGGYLSDLETSWMYGSSFVTGFVSRGSVRSAVSTVIGTERKYPTSFTATGSGFVKDGSFSRTILTSYPTPEVPRINLDLRSRQCLNIASLLAQVFLRK